MFPCRQPEWAFNWNQKSFLIKNSSGQQYHQHKMTMNNFDEGVFQDYLSGQEALLPKLLDVEKVSTRVVRILGNNPGQVCHPEHHICSFWKGIWSTLFFTRQFLTPVSSFSYKARIHTSLAAALTKFSSTQRKDTQSGSNGLPKPLSKKASELHNVS